MSKFKLKGSTTDEDLWSIFNNLPKEYNVILNGLENYLTLSEDDALTIKVIHKKPNH